ncbi:tRNA 5-methoxyuridine(34)/uridine 5-oxyacetic acid(34) synthase CmoB [Desulforhopalus vacuolatus]|uniref:tRNA 5-methoxyuridine(34)/uridine 5-oxyacetic acid(34) synthase CmoB n=1 Tax=Desulforhopalus vacuolatus TaxID=40414 RepID=UPI001966B4C3|nr:tRNA 5-methoxyuridine(34)/uridine 5-oxyacetic acid(34) synthase CmoB [Desulforhopalus vacuolatus]MBM9519911.1 tRNA 5-methoxyuridine(34)/uridine 5-oxyacetic acid(34) synthase CmoB [Desulforhopalus vacuolatus]
MHYLDRLPETANRTVIITEHEKKQVWVNQEKKGFLRYRNPCQALAQWQAHNCDFSGDTVSIGTEDEISSREKVLIRENLKAFMPWRKGPFSVFGNNIDAEWRSNLKWNQLKEELPELENKVIADIGCNNGYYMFRMAARKPRFVLGLEPSVQHYYCFKALNAMAGCSNLDIDLLGVEHLKYFVKCFDVVFLMGIIYHRPSPVDTLRDILTSLQPGGTMILETQAIPGNTPVALFPDGTYAKVPGTYFVPTASCLINWVRKAGFKNIKLFASHAMTPDIQRRTEWMIYESLSDYLDPTDPTRTVEGYPAPLRVFLKAEK